MLGKPVFSLPKAVEAATALNSLSPDRPSLRPVRHERPKIWDLPKSCHCVTLGTCLTLAELRKTAKRLGLFHGIELMTDYELHGAFVHSMSSRNRASSAVQKLLDANHAGAVRKASRCCSEEELSAFWDREVAEGQIAGAFWAVMSHMHLGGALEVRVFGEVHMMSHLCGASHRGDARARSLAEQQRAALARRLEQANAGHLEALATRDREIERLRRLVSTIEPFVREAATLRVRVADLEGGEETARLADKADGLARRLDLALRRNDRLAAEVDGLTDRLAAAEARTDELLDRLAEVPTCAGSGACADDCPFNLDGRCIAYIGGRPRTVSRMRDLVERCRGSLIHHDGGAEQSTETLDGVLVRADIVMFPVDCVSHTAVDKLKTICGRMNKTYLPLSSASYSSFASELARV
ncbi:DUF2325 domain-containing protein [Pleomorphomonas sp. JP5]|uniref:DUF2325 domain-containing protein n=1 Tax=Pleomorphomonas sp. JP5 TaxID=2942998 RepID=UPI002043A5EA|nr:DUF2325 domain-containing protein [Pleomorphomonas sp. JP5]MCM5556037.1 DUF2325 domain-containing protein [Pleomorphomonas sp. JP5]